MVQMRIIWKNRWGQYFSSCDSNHYSHLTLREKNRKNIYKYFKHPRCTTFCVSPPASEEGPLETLQFSENGFPKFARKQFYLLILFLPHKIAPKKILQEKSISVMNQLFEIAPPYSSSQKFANLVVQHISPASQRQFLRFTNII